MTTDLLCSNAFGGRLERDVGVLEQEGRLWLYVLNWLIS